MCLLGGGSCGLLGLGCGGSRGIWGWLWFSCGVAGGELVSVFRGFSVSISEALILAGGLGTRLSLYKV